MDWRNIEVIRPCQISQFLLKAYNARVTPPECLTATLPCFCFGEECIDRLEAIDQYNGTGHSPRDSCSALRTGLALRCESIIQEKDHISSAWSHLLYSMQCRPGIPNFRTPSDFILGLLAFSLSEDLVLLRLPRHVDTRQKFTMCYIYSSCK